MILLHSAVFAAGGDYGTDTVFMAGAGSRPDAMGGAFTAVADDLSAMHYNPAGLVNIKKQELSLLYYPLYESMSYGSAAYGQAILDFGTIGASLFRFTAGDIQGYDADENKTSVFGSEQYKAILSYAKKIRRGLSAGANLDIYYFNISRFNYAGFGADAGLLYEPFSFLRLGLMARNIITPVFSMQYDTETLPRLYTLGLLVKHSAAGYRFMAACDISAGESEGFKYRAGIEISRADTAAVRAGYGNGEITFGAGLSLYDIRFDYAYVSNRYFGRMDRFTLSYAFGMTVEEQRAQRRRLIYNEVRKIVDEKIRIKIREEADARYNRAYHHFRNGRHEEALAEIHKALEWKRDHEQSLKMKKVLEDALKEKLRSGVKAGITGASGRYVSAGIELYEKMQYDEAIKQWEQALKITPGDKAVRSLILKAQNAMKSASKRAQLTKEERDMADRMYYIAVNSYTSGDLKGAVELWKKVLAIDPDDIKTLRNLQKAQAELEELAKRGIE
ncbi:MAG TPA: PorV/PorQ family protein [bacterium]|nr:PorV/PorQ family protein [bacterium]